MGCLLLSPLGCRQTQIYVRIQLRIMTPVFVAVVLSLIFLALIPTIHTNCASTADGLVGNIASDLSMSLAALMLAILYMPKSDALDSPLLQVRWDWVAVLLRLLLC